MKEEDVKIVYAYIGYSDGTGSKESTRAKFYPKLPERILMFFTSIHTILRFPEEVLSVDNTKWIYSWCYGRKITRQQVVDFVDTLDDVNRQQYLQKIAEINDNASFMLVVEDRNNADAEQSEDYSDKQLGCRSVEDCIQFRSSFPMCSKQFLVHEPEVELGYVRGVFTGCDEPFFAKLWRSKQSGIKYVTIVYDFFCEEEMEYQEQDSDDEAISVLNKSGLDVVGHIYDAYELSQIIQHLSQRGVFRYTPDQRILNYSCYLCKDMEGNSLLAYTTEVTEPYEDEPMKTKCNLDFMTHRDDSRAVDLLEEKVKEQRPGNGYQERFKIVKEAIDQWDKIGLRGWAPNDEYDGLSDFITAIINESSGVDEIAEAISYVFSLMFWERGNSPDKCIWPAKLIREEFDMRFYGVVDKSGKQKISDDQVSKFTINN